LIFAIRWHGLPLAWVVGRTDDWELAAVLRPKSGAAAKLHAIVTLHRLSVKADAQFRQRDEKQPAAPGNIV
jgi:hypothetical protein